MEDKKKYLVNDLDAKKYLYETNLQNVFNDYENKIAKLDESKKQDLEQQYIAKEMSKKYLGEYASNKGINDVSGGLLDIYGNYAKNRQAIDSNYSILKANYDKEFQDKKAALDTDLYMTQYAMKRNEKVNQVKYNIKTGNTDGLSTSEYLDKMKNELPQDVYWELKNIETDKNLLQDNKDFYINVIKGNIPEEYVNMGDYLEYGVKTGKIDLDAFANLWEQEGQRELAKISSDFGNIKNESELNAKLQENAIFSPRLIETIKAQYNAFRTQKEATNYSYNLLAGIIPQGFDEMSYLKSGLDKGFVGLEQVGTYFNKKNDLDSAKFALDIQNTTSEKEINDLLNAKGVNDTNSLKNEQYKMLAEVQKRKLESERIRELIETDSIPEKMSKVDFIEKNRNALGEHYLPLKIQAVNESYNTNSTRLMNEVRIYKTQEEWEEAVNSAYDKKEITKSMQETLKGYWRNSKSSVYNVATDYVNPSVYKDVPNGWKEKGKQYKNANGDVLAETNDLVSEDSKYYNDLAEQSKNLGDYEPFSYAKKYYVRNNDGSFSALERLTEYQFYNEEDNKAHYDKIKNDLVKDDIQVKPTIYYSSNGKTVHETLKYDKDAKQFKKELQAVYTKNGDRRGIDVAVDGDTYYNKHRNIQELWKGNPMENEVVEFAVNKYFGGKFDNLKEWLSETNANGKKDYFPKSNDSNTNKTLTFRYNNNLYTIYANRVYKLTKR